MARESIEQALPDSNLSIHPMQIGAGYCATRSANRLVFCDSLMQTAISKRGTPLGLASATLRRKTSGIGIANPHWWKLIRSVGRAIRE